MVITLQQHKYGLGAWLNASPGVSYDCSHDVDGSTHTTFHPTTPTRLGDDVRDADGDDHATTMSTHVLQESAGHMMLRQYTIHVLVVRLMLHATTHDTRVRRTRQSGAE